MPSVGEILAWAEPTGPGIRVDTGFAAGQTISRHYDSLIAKVIAFGEDRPSAIRRLRGALLDFHVLGISTNIPFVLDVLSHPSFEAGDFDTGFLAREFGGWQPGVDYPEGLGAVAVASTSPMSKSEGVSVKAGTAWDATDGFRVAPSLTSSN
jgi:acetyl/propionyl-CoA carboxylase alpha subunit